MPHPKNSTRDKLNTTQKQNTAEHNYPGSVTLGQETRWAYTTTTSPSPHGAIVCTLSGKISKHHCHEVSSICVECTITFSIWKKTISLIQTLHS